MKNQVFTQLRFSHVVPSWESVYEGLQPTGDFLALHLGQAHSAIWTEAGIREMPQNSWAQIIFYCVTLGKEHHHSESHFPSLQN